MQKDEPVTAGSKILNGFKSPITATVVERLLASGYKIAGRAETSEFGISGENLGAVKTLESGAAEYALCNDIFGNYRKQAPMSNLCYIHPTYGTVSRYGLVQTAASMAQIGVLCKNVTDGLTLLSKIAGHDPKDGAMFGEASYSYDKPADGIRIGIPAAVTAKADESARYAINELAGKFQQTSVELDYFDVYSQVMCILSSAEISNNISRYDGIKYGNRAAEYRGIEDLYVKTRTEAFGIDAKQAAIMGCLVLSQDYYEKYYDKAMRIRRLIKESSRFDDYDIIALPCNINGDNNALFALAALAGLPACSFSYNGQGVQLIANARHEHLFKAVWEGLSI